ncbi:23S rRNA (adenine(2030)-N(6))-methyltransferase RlmJ [Coralloluteibacterium stylophorae]|uniref:Ribosomal RNA large subunit methyltransferase J n=1 Tax=Coralloluteibacterium stylophorae TaxID=1776034 RepID=A0A8J7VSP6_9GAMM|nr:23S rRNA (adenine(2030)-N(6))-methyltransferase RlmJ [Coralloluteibacterium stylophorae]MBS7458680.1 23S rRNA (adenine(2030)-N(6))-methyltransferase RlmJ [Coralloluteibacterium stylophorae]
MNYRHAFHAGNHADVLKHVVLLAILDALVRKDTPCFVLDTHAGRGHYPLDRGEALRTDEAAGGIGRLFPITRGLPPAVARYRALIQKANPDGRLHHYPGSPLLAAQVLRGQDRLACCELQVEEAEALRSLFAGDRRVGVHARDGYGAIKALTPPQEKRGVVLIDPPYENQLAEFDAVRKALAEGLARWPQGCFALWYPIKDARVLKPVFRRMATLPAKSILRAELVVHGGDSPLRMNGSGMLVFNVPWQLDMALAPALPWLARELGEAGAHSRVDWLKQPE